MSLMARFRLERPGFRLEADLDLSGRGLAAVIGTSGSGKTTLLRCLAGLEHPHGGFLEVAGATWQDEARGIFLAPHRRPVGYVFQEAALFPHRSVGGNLAFGYRRIRPGDRRLRWRDVVELLGLGRLLERRTEGLSGGERQRVAIGRALLTSPRLLLLDEPLSALDRPAKAEILPYLERLRDEGGIPIVYVSHDPTEVARLADEGVLLEKGRVAGAGDLPELLTRLDLALAHGDEAEAVIDARVAGHDEGYALTLLEFSGGRLTVPRQERRQGERVRVVVRARDVSLTLQPPVGTTILNVLPARIEELEEEDQAQVMVRLSVGGRPLLARITRKSRDALELRPGARVFAQVKGVALTG